VLATSPADRSCGSAWPSRAAGLDAPRWGAGTVTIHFAGYSTAAIFPDTASHHARAGRRRCSRCFQSSVRVDDASLSAAARRASIYEAPVPALEAKIVPGDYLFVEFAATYEKMTISAALQPTVRSHHLPLQSPAVRQRGLARAAFVVLMTRFAGA